MTRTQRILGLSGICLLLSGFAGCYFNRETADTDLDGDGWDVGADCNDDVASIYPGAPEVCGNGLDDDCDGKVDFDDPECQSEGIGGDDNPTGAGGDGMGGMGQGGDGQGGQGLGVGGDGGGGFGGAGTGGSAAGGSGQGGSGQGGSAQGGSAQGGSSQGGAGQGGS